jgi:hypothetical protein
LPRAPHIAAAEAGIAIGVADRVGWRGPLHPALARILGPST